MPRVNTKRCDNCARHEFKQQGCSFWVPEGCLEVGDFGLYGEPAEERMDGGADK